MRVCAPSALGFNTHQWPMALDTVLGRVPPSTEEWLEADARLADSTRVAWGMCGLTSPAEFHRRLNPPPWLSPSLVVHDLPSGGDSINGWMY